MSAPLSSLIISIFGHLQTPATVAPKLEPSFFFLLKEHILKSSANMQIKGLLTIVAAAALTGEASAWLTFKPLGGVLAGLPKSNQDGYTTLAYFPVIIRQPTAVPQPPPQPPVTNPIVNAMQNADTTCKNYNGPSSRGIIDSAGTHLGCTPMKPGCP